MNELPKSRLNLTDTYNRRHSATYKRHTRRTLRRRASALMARGDWEAVDAGQRLPGWYD